MKAGDGVILMGMWGWLTFSVGPRWLGWVLLGIGFGANLVEVLIRRRMKP